MPNRDDEVLLKLDADARKAQAVIQGFVTTSDKALDQLDDGREIVVEVAQAQRRIDLLLEEIGRVRQRGESPIEVEFRLEAALEELRKLDAKLEAVRTKTDTPQAADPFGPLRESAARAQEAVGQAAATVAQDSRASGSAVEDAFVDARLALESYVQAMDRAQKEGSPIPEEALRDLMRLEKDYQEATIAARRYIETTDDVRAGVTRAINPSRELAGSVSRITDAVRIFAAAAAAELFRRFAGGIIEAGREAEKFERVLKQATGSQEGANEALRVANQLADDFGGSVGVLVRGYGRVAAAAKGTRAEGEGVKLILTALAASNVVAGGSAEDLNGQIKAVTDSLSKNRITAEELRGQLGDRMPGAIQKFQRALQLSGEDLDSLLASGAIKADVALQHLARTILDEMAEEIPEAVNAAGTEIDRLGNRFDRLRRQLGAEVVPAIGDFSKALNEAGENQAAVTGFAAKVGAQLVKNAALFVRSASGVVTFVQSIASGLEGIGVAAVRALAKPLAALEKVAELSGLDAFAAKARGLRLEIDQSLGNLSSALFEQSAEKFAQARRELTRARDAFEGTGEEAERAALSVEELGEAGEEAGGKFAFVKAAMQDASDSIAEYAKQVRNSGNVQREEADKIVGEVRKLIKSIRQLPPEEEAALADRLKILEALEKEFVRFTSEYQKLQEKQAKAAHKTAEEEAKALAKREEALRNFVKTVAEIFREGEQEQGNATAEALTAQLRQFEAELRGLEGGTTLSIDEENRIAELKGQISETSIELSRLGVSADEVSRQVAGIAEAAPGREVFNAISEALSELVTESEAFAGAFRDLSAPGQERLGDLLQQVEHLAEAGQLTRREFAGIADEIAQVFQLEGLVSPELAAELAVLTGESVRVSDALALLAQGAGPAGDAMQAAGEQAGGLADAANAAGSAVAGAAQASTAAAPAFEAAGRGTLTFRGEVVELGSAAETAAGGVVRFGDQVIQLGEAASQAAGGTLEFRGEVVKFGEDGKVAGDKARETAADLDAYYAGAKAAGEASEEAAAGAKELAEAIEPVASHVPGVVDLGEAMGELEPRAKGVRELSEAAGELATAGEALGPVASHVTALDAALQPVPSHAVGVRELGEAIASVSEADTSGLESVGSALGAVGESAATAAGPVEEAAGSVGRLAGAAESAASGAGDLADATRQAATGSRDLAKAQGELSRAIIVPPKGEAYLEFLRQLAAAEDKAAGAAREHGDALEYMTGKMLEALDACEKLKACQGEEAAA